MNGKKQNRPFLFFCNRLSGKGDKQRIIDTARRLAESSGRNFLLFDNCTRDQFDQLANRAVQKAEKTGGTLVVSGGDGTVRAMVQKCLGHSLQFAIVPGGTFNYFAREHKIPQDLEAALQVALTGEAKPIYVGRLDEHVFLLNASLGLYPKAIQERRQWRDVFGRRKSVNIISTFTSMLRGHRNLHLDLTYEGGTSRFKTPMLFVGHNALQLKINKLQLTECINQGKLGVVVMKPTRTLGLLIMSLKGLMRGLRSAKNLQSFCAKDLIVSSPEQKLNVALDGELFEMEPPFHLQVCPTPLNLVQAL